MHSNLRSLSKKSEKMVLQSKKNRRAAIYYLIVKRCHLDGIVSSTIETGVPWWQTAIKAIILIIASSFAIFQFFTLTKEYLEYEVTQNTTLQIPEFAEIPGITFSVSRIPLLHYARLCDQRTDVCELLKDKHNVTDEESFYNFSTTNLGRSVLDRTARNFTVKQLFRSSYTAKEFAWFEVIVDSREGTYNANKTFIDDQCNTKTYLKHGRIWFSYACQLLGRNMVRNKELSENFITHLARMELNSKLFQAAGTVYIFLNTQNHVIQNWRKVGLPLSWESVPKTYHLSYRRTEVNLLPPPYKTNCKDYSEDGYVSRFDAIEQCENRIGRERFNISFPENHRLPDDESVVDYGTTRMDNEDVAQGTWSFCEKTIAQEDCNQQYYTPLLTPGGTNWRSRWEIMFRPSLEPEFIISTNPKTSFATYVSLVGSILAFWFPFSLSGFLIDALPHLGKVKTFRKKVVVPLRYKKRDDEKSPC